MPPFPVPVFRRSDHVYHCPPIFGQLMVDAIRFFNGTPVHTLPPPQTFKGAGVYAIYCTAKAGIYQKFGNVINQLAYNIPIYVGKAVAGSRQSRNTSSTSTGSALYSRLAQHARSIELGAGLNPGDFYCRFAIFEDAAERMIAAVEAALIAETNPLWNSVIDGFGNHDPGKGRHAGRMPQWDCLHPGRPWAARLQPCEQTPNALKRRVSDYMVGLRVK